ncbi:MAG: hypothetical protein QM762_25690 [Chryseolinea sp.]
MKRITSIGLVLLMSLQCFYKLGVITYFTINREYIAEVLCVNKSEPIPLCQGSCFLKKNLDLADKATDTSGLPGGRQQTVEFPVFLISQINYRFSFMPDAEGGNSGYLPGTSCKYLPAPFHPPSQLIG